jgi:hypothetical protein
VIIKKIWTAEDDARLKRFIEQGASALRTASAMKRRVLAVRIRARKLGLAFPTVRERRQHHVDVR